MSDQDWQCRPMVEHLPDIYKLLFSHQYHKKQREGGRERRKRKRGGREKGEGKERACT